MLNLENLLPVGRKVDRCVIVIRFKMFYHRVDTSSAIFGPKNSS